MSQRIGHMPGKLKPRLRKYPIWSVRTITIVSLLLTVIVAVVVLWIGKESLLVEAEWISVIVAACLFLFLFAGLYRGIRIRKNEPVPSNFEFINVDTSNVGDLGDIGSAMGSTDDLAGILLAPILFILFAVVLIFLLPLLINLVWLLLFVFVVMLFWIFRAALRQVFAKSRFTRGNVVSSLGYASLYTLLYAGWLVGVLVIARAIA